MLFVFAMRSLDTPACSVSKRVDSPKSQYIPKVIGIQERQQVNHEIVESNSARLPRPCRVSLMQTTATLHIGAASSPCLPVYTSKCLHQTVG